jgi:peptidoglycan/LPS O-acetylase OafA/YrhL
MRSLDALDRAALVLGLVSIVSGVFVFVDGTFQLVQIGAVGLVVALVLGLLAVVAGCLDERTLMLAAGAGFLLAAAVQLALLAGGSSGFVGGNASTFSLWLGLGVGLIAIGVVRGPETTDEPSQVTA